MKPLRQTFKASIRQLLKDGGTLWHGYPFYYAQLQDREATPRYCYQWSEITTPIKRRSSFAEVNENRLWNMQLAARDINGLLLHPGQIFGFWNRVARPTVANGFREGPTLVGNRLMTDVGGGLCQISTTLFQALLWADCQILERHNHSIDAHGDKRFFTLGQDATVAYGYKDLIVRNNSQVPLQLRLQVLAEKAEVTASVWGTEPKPVEVKVSSTVLAKLPPPDANGMPGWQVETIRYVRSQSRIEVIPNPSMLATDTFLAPPLTRGAGGVKSVASKKEIGMSSLESSGTGGLPYAPTDWQADYRTIDLYKPHV
jgi:vancomycin resistance protein VanW